MPKATFFNLPEDKRNLILDLAIEEFAENDYENASLSRIVARAGIAKGSVYQYFEDKRELYLYLIQLAADEKKQFLANTPPPDPGMNLFDFLRWLVQQGARFELSRPKLAQVAYRALFLDRPFGDQPFAQLREAAKEYYVSLVNMGKAQGVIDAQIDSQMAVFLLNTIFTEFGRYLIEREGVDPKQLAEGEVDYQKLPIEDQVDQLITILERGLAPRFG